MKYWGEGGGAQVGRVVGSRREVLALNITVRRAAGLGRQNKEECRGWQGWRAGSESSRLGGNWGDLPVEKGTHCVQESSAIFRRLETAEGSRTEQ